MSDPMLEARVAALEAALAEMKQRLDARDARPAAADKKWWEGITPMSEEELRAVDEMAPYTAYFRQTGQDPPPDWKPGDPIPEPDYWK